VRPILLVSIITHTCYSGSRVMLSLLALDLGQSQFVVGVVAALYAVVPLVLGVAIGRLADRIGVRIPLLLGASLAGIALLCSFALQNFAALTVTATLMGAAFVLNSVSAQKITGDLGKGKDNAHNVSLLTSGYSISTFLGPVLAGFSIERLGYRYAFLSFALITLVPIFVVALHPRFTRAEPKESGPQNLRVLDLLRAPPLRTALVISGLVVAAYDLFGFYMPIYGHSLGLPASTIGMIMGAYACATFLARLALPLLLSPRRREEQVLVACMLFAAAGFALMPFVSGPYALASLALVVGAGVGTGQPISLALAFDRSPPGRSGEVAGLRFVLGNTCRLVIPIAAGALGTLGTSPVFWMNAANLGVIGWLAHRDGQRVQRADLEPRS
jgi:MFS family permease